MTMFDIDRLAKLKSLSKKAIDSRMLLLRGQSDRSTLEVIPRTSSNIARFLNSVGQRSKYKQNAMSVWAEVEKQMTILIYTTRRIKVGEELLYD